MKLLLLAILTLTCVQHQVSAAKFVCYFPNWAFYRTGSGKFTVDNINPQLCTHLIYAFAVLNPTDYTLSVFDSWADIDNQMYAKFVGLKKSNPSLKTIIAIGGATDSQSSKYSQLVADPAKITKFVNSVVAFLKQYGFDGLDVDWEFPSAGDKVGFGNLLKALRSAFNQNGYLLSVAVSAGQSTIDTSYDVPTINQNVDFINLMTYDMHGSWESKADHHAPLYKRSWETVNNNVDFITKYWISKGASASKIVLGIPLYGRSFTLSTSTVTPPATSSGAGAPGPYTGEGGLLAYYEICSKIRTNGWKSASDPNMFIGPYAYLAPTWVGYDDANMAAYKAKYALANGLGGAMVWDISMDDFGNLCGGGTNPLLNAISTALLTTSTNTTTVAPTTTTKPTTLTQTTTSSLITTGSTTKPPATSTSATKLPGTTAGTTKLSTTTKPPTTTTQAATTTTTVKPATATLKTTVKNSVTTAKPSTFTCPTSSGLYANPSSCTSYYTCNFGQAILMQCPSGLYFNPAYSYCDWPANVNCSVGK